MKNLSSNNKLFRQLSLMLIVTLSAKGIHAGSTALATEPFTSTAKVNALPNVFFVLDDSGSMSSNYLPDWAGEPHPVTNLLPGEQQFRNAAFNGVAYNPETRYRPPVMYTSSGALDTTTYPSMDGTSASNGGDASATTTSRNWRAVKVDGYGIQSTDKKNLESGDYLDPTSTVARFFTTTSGEYCTTAQLRTCIAASAPSGSYTFPAKLRWCTTAAKALASTSDANGFCQASNIDNSAANIANGVTPYIYARFPGGRTTSITVNSTADVGGITVSGLQIMAGTASGGSTTSLAAAIATQINACTKGLPTTPCAVVGFRAVSAGNVVSIRAPGVTTATPVVSGGSTTVNGPFSKDAGDLVPGETMLSVITPAITSYPKSTNRTDCVGSTCTYAEEMTNYANWFAYYQTRMQMMKTAASIAFSNVDDKFRVGYFSINNGGTSATGGDFLNVSAFDGAQKHAWYSMFFLAKPFGTTPLRTALSNAGKVYAGKLGTLYSKTVVDPMQYSCQQNYTILSTDGYWNDTSSPTNIQNTAIGNQDGNDPRPYYDGSTQTRTSSQTTRTDYQTGYNAILVEERTQQQQTSTRQLDQGITTTKIYPFTETLTQLRSQETPLIKGENYLQKRTYPLKADTRQLEERVFQLTSTTYPLERYTFNLQETTRPLQSVVTKITKTVSPLQVKEEKITKTVYPLQIRERFLRSITTPVQSKEDKITRTTSPLQKITTNITVTTTPLLKSTYKLQSSTRQLQKRESYSTNGGDKWFDTGWQNATSCTVTTTGVVTVVNSGYWTKDTQCQYTAAVIANDLTSCTAVAASPGPTNYTVAQPVVCTYQSTPLIEPAASCTVVAQGAGPNFVPQVACAYGTTASSTLTGQATCTARNQSGASTMSGDKVECAYDSSSTTTAAGGSCTRTTSNTGALPKVDCAYGAATTPTTGLNSCTANDQSVSNPTTWTGDKSVCVFENTTTFANVSSGGCTARAPADFSQTRIQCQWGTPGTPTAYNLTACTANSSMSVGSQIVCELQPTSGGGAATFSNLASGTCTVRNSASNTRTAIDCRYGTTASSTSTTETSCTANDASATRGSNFSSGTSKTGDQVTCAWTASSFVTATGGTCTPRTPAAFENTRITCGYGAAGAPSAGNTSCSQNDQTGVTTTWTGDKVVCAWDATPTTSTVTSCTWSVPASPSTTRTTCQYAAGSITGTNLATCTPDTLSSGSANGTVWTGPKKQCAYMAGTVATNQTTCSPTGTNNGTSAYTTCGYGAGVASTNLNSCVVDPQEAGPNFTQGSYTACQYQGAYTSSNVASCTPVAQSGTFSAPEKQCVYAAPVTTTNLASCSNQAQSSSAPFAGPAVNCYYDTTASATNLNVTSCNANRQTTSPFTGPAVDCAYNATAVVTSDVSTCSVVAASSGPNFVGPAVSCAYDVADDWATATSSCTQVAKSTTSPYVGPARECAYNGTVTTNLVGASCNNAESTENPFSILQKKECTPGSFPEVTGPVNSVVDSCSTDPTSNTDPASLIRTDTSTTCTYRTAVVANAAACTPAAASGASPYTTAITCPVSDTGWVPVEPSCTAIGVLGSSGPPASAPTFDGTGKAVGCRTTDVTAYTASYPNGPVPIVCNPVPNPTTTDPATKVQTTCTVMQNTTAPVATCTPVDPPTGPSFLRSTCNTTTSSTSVMGCTPIAPTSPQFETVTCVDNGDGTSNTLADVAAYYYKTDLRQDITGFNNCTGAVVPPATTGNNVCLNNVLTSASDPNNAQHMTTYTLGLGASGYMQYSSKYPVETVGDFATVKGVSPYAPENGIAADPANGICSWQTTGNCNWPIPASGGQTTIDDLWHAGVNGHGAYFSATDPVSLANSISSALGGVKANGGAAAAPALSTPTLAPADNYVWISTFKTYDWTGEVVRRQIDPFTGIVSPVDDWAVQAKLNAKLPADRKIYVFDSGVASTKLKPFTAANYGTNSYFNSPHISTAPNGLTQFICASTDICLSSTDQDSSHAAGANLVEYLRGVRTHEGADTDNTKYYRARQHVLGDMVNAQTVYVSVPKFAYADPGYSAFVTAQATRQPVVYAAANDGMLHAFAAKGSAATEALVEAAATANAKSYLDPGNASFAAAATAATAAARAAVAADTVVGQELWGFIPATVLPNLYRLADKRYAYSHRPYVDATPVVGDVCVSDCSATTAVWKTILVGGLGRGGRGYYALDITDPSSPKALWEFTDSNLGYTFGNPQIAKRADGTWVVMFTSGYNNIPNDDGTGGDGVGRLYVLNAATGAQISGLSPISTGVGGTSAPSGLTKITAQVVNPSSDNTAEAVYGGDLLGNLWRFDINDTIGASGYDAQLLATLKDGAGNAQSITSKPEVGLIEGYKVVFVGTGRFLDSSDIGDTGTQTLYAIKDPRAPLTNPSVPIFDNPGGSPRVVGNSSANFIRQVQSEIDCPTGNTNCVSEPVAEKIRTSTNNPVSFATNNGWFVDLIGTGERANTDPALGLGLLAFNTNTPSLVACDIGGKGYGYFLDYLTGGPIYGPGNGTSTANNGMAGGLLANELVSSPALAVTKGGKLIILSGLSGGGIISKTPPQPAPASITRRTSWRELIRGN